MNKKLCVVVGLGVLLASTAAYSSNEFERIRGLDQSKSKNCERQKKLPAPVPRTGQTMSYAAGDDGALQKGVAWPIPRFIKNVNRDQDDGSGQGKPHNEICDGTETCNGTVTDRLTGLVWLRNATCHDFPNPSDWNTALLSANALASGACGLTDGSIAGDWRLPNIKELHSLSDFAFISPALSNTAGTGQWSEGDPFFGLFLEGGMPVFNFWSSTSFATDSRFAFDISLSGTGAFGDDYKVNEGSVWPIRGGQSR